MHIPDQPTEQTIRDSILGFWHRVFRTGCVEITATRSSTAFALLVVLCAYALGGATANVLGGLVLFVTAPATYLGIAIAAALLALARARYEDAFASSKVLPKTWSLLSIPKDKRSITLRNFIWLPVCCGIAVFCAGALIAAFAGAWTSYATSPVPYIQAASVSACLCGMLWAVSRIPRTLMEALSVLRHTPAQRERILLAWRDSGWLTWGIAGWSLVFLAAHFLSWQDSLHILSQQAAPGTHDIATTFYSDWLGTQPAWFFAFWYHVVDGALISLLLGAAASGLCAWLQWTRSLLQAPVDLATSAHLARVPERGLHLSYWALAAAAGFLLASGPALVVRLFNGETAAEQLVSLLLAGLAVLFALAIIGLPQHWIHVAILKEKLTHEDALLHRLRLELERVRSLPPIIEPSSTCGETARLSSSYAGSERDAAAPPANEGYLQALSSRIDTLKRLLEQVRDISSWPGVLASLRGWSLSSAITFILPIVKELF
jgi:hypothetical protein